MNKARTKSESGVALIAALLIMLLMSTLLAGFTVVVMSDQQNRWVDRERTRAFYASHAAIEKLTADLGVLFSTNLAPTPAQLAALQTHPPTTMSDVSFVAADGTPGYALTYTPDANGNPTAEARMIASGPYEGMTGLVTKYTVDVTSRTKAGGETHLRRQLETVAIPVFQFGVFSETDLSFFPGPVFNFGGRVHTNANLYLASGNTLTLSDRVTAVNEVIRTNLSNGWPTSTNYTGAVNVVTVPGSTRPLATTEGSLVGTVGSALNDPTWMNLTMGPYAGSLRNGRTGAHRLDLALVTIGGQPVDLVRRPASVTENVTNPSLFGQRYFSYASLRILLSDTPAKIQNLPTVTAAAPMLLEGPWTAAPPAGYNGGVIDAAHPPIALSSGNALDGYRTVVGTPVIGGNIKIEAQDPAGNWRDVTGEILSLGIAGPNISNPNGGPCATPSPNAIIRLQRVRNVPAAATGPLGLLATPDQKCGVGTTLATDFWPNVLYDPREGNVRDVAPANLAQVALGGVMHYVELDVNNLRRWFLGQIGATGLNVMNTTGYVVYFSDRRGNQNAAGNETGEYGFEDTVNPASAAGAPNGVLDVGEDVNGNGVLDTYGGTPRANGATAPLGVGATPGTFVDPAVAQTNQAVFFRRALKLTNGTLGNIIAPGLTIVSENPLYVQGDYNASAAGGFGNPHVATAILADAVTFLSNAWNDVESFTSPNNLNGRQAVDTWYRVAIMAGKTPSFPQPTAWGAAQDFGTDGGVHNFIRYIENWGNGSTLWYRGSLASFYYSRQATGTYKCCTQVYSPPTRGYNFDLDFLTPSLLPPRTPAFRDLNTLGFTQITTAGK